MILQGRAEITYPCEWTYKVIGTDPELMKRAVNSIIQPETFSIEKSHASRTGKYVSLNIELVVFSEEERNRYHKGLSQHKDIKMVL